jgi:hypothetical protein
VTRSVAKASVYSRWDGSHEAFSLDAGRALDALSDLRMEGLDAREALEWMRQHGFELAGLDLRVMGLQELLEELGSEAREQAEALSRRLDEILDREQSALQAQHGFESRRLNDFLERRHADTANVGEAIDRFRDHDFEDADAERDFQELLEALERLRGLEQMMRDLAEGNLQQISPEQLGELLGEDAMRSLVLIRDLESTLEKAGYLRGGSRV